MPAYIPNVVYTPMLVEKGDAKINAYYGVAGADFQIAYAITNNIGLMVNTSFTKLLDRHTRKYYNRHNFVELGAGYFLPYSKSNIVSVYGGFGYGNIERRYRSSEVVKLINANSIRFFIQPAIGIHTDLFDGSFSTRVVGHMPIAEQNKMFIYIEPIITNKIGSKYGKLVVQVGLSFHTTDLYYQHNPFMFSIGIELNIGKIIKRNKHPIT